MDPTQIKRNYVVAESYGKGGATAFQALSKYGQKMLSLSELYPLFGNKNLRAENAGILRDTVPVWTRTHVVLSKRPLAESIQKDGQKTFLFEKSDFEDDAWYCQIPDELLKNRDIMKMPNILFKFENGYEVKEIGKNQYLTIIRDVKNIKFGPIFEEESTETKLNPLIFGKEMENMRVVLNTPGVHDVRVGIVSAGNVVFDGFDGVGSNAPIGVFLPDWSNQPLGVLVYPDNPKP